MQPWKSKDTLESNPIGLSNDATARLIPELDAHLASLFVLFHQYQKHPWIVEGPQFRDLHLFLGEAYQEVHQQTDRMAVGKHLSPAIQYDPSLPDGWGTRAARPAGDAHGIHPGDAACRLSGIGTERALVGDMMRREFQTADSSEMLETAFARLQTCECHTMPVMHSGQLVRLVTMDNVGEFLMIQAALHKKKG